MDKNNPDTYFIYIDEKNQKRQAAKHNFQESHQFACNASGMYAVTYSASDVSLNPDYDPTDTQTIILENDTKYEYIHSRRFLFDTKYMLAVFQADGTLVYDLTLSELPYLEYHNEYTNLLFPLILTDDGYVCMIYDNYLFIIDPQGTFLKAIELPNNHTSNLSSLYKTPDGTCYIVYPSNDKIPFPIYCTIDCSTLTLSEPITLQNTNIYDKLCFSTKQSDGSDTVFSSDGLNLYQHQKDGTKEILFDWSSMNIIGSKIDTIYSTTENNHFVVITRDILNDNPEVVFINYIPADTVPQKTELVIASGEYNDRSTRALQIASTIFNRKSKDYKVKVEYYPVESDSMFSVNQQIANDMAQGKQIDLILFHDAVTMEYFDNLGILGDWYPLIDGDADYTREDFLPCIRAAYETTAGTLPVLTTDFGLTTLAGAQNTLNGMESWTYAECMAYMDTLDWDQILLQLAKNDTDSPAMLVLKGFLPVILDDYIDEDTGSCSFDSDSFREFLTLCTKVLINHDQAIEENAANSSERIYKAIGLMNEFRRGKTVLYNNPDHDINGKFSIQYPSDVMNILDNYFPANMTGSNVTFIGYPHAENSTEPGTAVTPYVQFGLTANAEHTDGAWEFMKGYLSYQVNRIQKQENAPYLPCTYDAFHAQLDAYETYTYLFPGTQYIQEYTDFSSQGSGYSLYHAANMEVRAVLTDLVETATRRYSGNQAVMDIIFEEAAYFFDGIHSLTDITARIQNRAGIYLSEHMG
ncbi:MAG: extracellular solute-binding protein [Clostridia bacterium]|nr:extracellular solute-binding protein [Clostridia bacterium]